MITNRSELIRDNQQRLQLKNRLLQIITQKNICNAWKDRNDLHQRNRRFETRVVPENINVSLLIDAVLQTLNPVDVDYYLNDCSKQPETLRTIITNMIVNHLWRLE